MEGVRPAVGTYGAHNTEEESAIHTITRRAPRQEYAADSRASAILYNQRFFRHTSWAGGWTGGLDWLVVSLYLPSLEEAAAVIAMAQEKT